MNNPAYDVNSCEVLPLLEFDMTLITMIQITIAYRIMVMMLIPINGIYNNIHCK